MNPIVTFPGKAGDLLFAVPTMRALRELYDQPLTLVTTQYCTSVLALVMEQPDLWSGEGCYIDDTYRPVADQPGMQPALVTVPSALLAHGHRDVLHLGLTRMPYSDESIVDTIAEPWVLGRVRHGPWLSGGVVDRSGPLVVHAPIKYARWLDVMVRRLARRERVVVVAPPDEAQMLRVRWGGGIESVDVVETVDLADVRDVAVGASGFFGVASSVGVAMAGLGYPCRWMMQPGSDKRWIPVGCDVTIEEGTLDGYV